MIYPAANQFVARWIPQQERGFVNGLIFAGVGAGSGLSPPLLRGSSSIMAGATHFWFSAIVGCIAGCIWWVFARDTPEEHAGVSREELKEIRAGLPLETSAPVIGGGKLPSAISWRAIFTRGTWPR